VNEAYGIVEVDGVRRPAARLGDRALDLAAAEGAGLLDAGGTLSGTGLHPFLSAGPPTWQAVRDRLAELRTDPRIEPLLHPLGRPILPFHIADYVDFYASEHHAANMGRMLRPGQPPLLPNWRHLPVGYHGRAGTVVVSGTPVVRPCGQRGPGSFGPTERLDIEAEVGFVVGVPTRIGEPVTVDRFADHVFGVVLVNDWSARDLQAWESRPLGPFLGKSFATSISAWITPLAALAGAWTPLPAQEPEVSSYLREPDRRGLDLSLSVRWNGTVVSRPPFAALYWTPAQMLAHLTVTGAALRTGDLYASGTVSGPEPDQVGSFAELGQGFLADGDTVTIEATAPAVDGGRLTLAEVTGTVLPARC
jgi:fumarylacetoacetase